MGVEVRLEGRVDLRRGEGEEGSAGNGACVVDEDCAGAELEERVLVVVELHVVDIVLVFSAYIFLY